MQGTKRCDLQAFNLTSRAVVHIELCLIVTHLVKEVKRLLSILIKSFSFHVWVSGSIMYV